MSVFSDCQIVLFLRNIKSIAFFDKTTLVFKIEKREGSDKIRQLYYNDKLLNSWLTKDFIIPIGEDLRNKLRRLSDEECPQKLKEARSTKITLAGLVKADILYQVKDSLIYCYLPTKVSKTFPYIVNADFITNAERTQLLENDWNHFLFQQIGTQQFEWLKELHTTSLKYQTTKLLKKKFLDTSISLIEKGFNEGFHAGISTVAFVPEEGKNNLLKLSECIVDSTGFTSGFGATTIPTFLSKPLMKVVDLRLEHSEMLLQIGAIDFNIDSLCQLLSSDGLQKGFNDIPKGNFKVIQFLYQKTAKDNPEWLEPLKKTKFLLDDNSELKTPRDLFSAIR